MKATKRSGFTLVELLVVIGIIAVLVGILLPVINRARKQANAVACQANMRGLMQGLLGYAADNKGSMPCGFMWNEMNAAGTPLNPGSTGASAFHWSSVLESRNTKDGNAGLYPKPALTSGTFPLAKLSKAYLCAEVDRSQFGVTPCNYGLNCSILVNTPLEIAVRSGSWAARGRAGISMSQLNGTPVTTFPVGPAKLSQLFGDNAVLWDTTGFAGDGFLINRIPSFTVSDIDGWQLCQPAPQNAYLRYRGSAYYKQQVLSPYTDPEQPINYANMHAEKVTYSFGFPWVNADVAGGTVIVPNQWGGPRWRHGKNDTCMVAFADGSVRGLRISTNKALSYDADASPNDFYRKYLLIKAPGALPPKA